MRFVADEPHAPIDCGWQSDPCMLYAASVDDSDGNWRHPGALLCPQALSGARPDRIRGATMMTNNSADTQSWVDWQQAVVTLIRQDFSEVLTQVGEEDVDWDAWRPLYEQGMTPREAVADAFLLLPA